MGIKFLSFHMLPYCFHLISNHITCLSLPPSHSPAPTIKLIKSDGHIDIYHRPIPASDLMRQFPKHLICDSDSFFLGQRIPALSATDTLQLGHNYFLLPSHLFQSVLSFITVASFASSSKKPATCRPFDVHKTPSGTLQIRVSDEFIDSLLYEGEEGEKTKKEKVGRVCSTPELEKDYTRLVGCERFKEWRPKLETINEKERRKLGGFGMRRRKKSQNKGSQTSLLHVSRARKGS
ncbi:uncharacterized protein LOC131239243 [Magnolia sinica]|uniref:uncharacterized protein LOC131239243 n=1 Tax=Magnolia sinica TaxID=86752 RepID=UPI00265B0162|nr:uncharacterized protein LOC131239243 [Magnolia sinica]